jgi:histidinol-phosphatase
VILPELLAFAHELADAADAISLPAFGGPVSATTKPDGSPVTEVDRAVEAALRARIGAAYPDHAVFGEEEGGRIDADVPTWVIDPIDATKNFLRGLPIFATMIGVLVGSRPVVGVVSAPAMGERWDGAAGQGARRNGERVSVSAIATLADSHVLHGGLSWFRSDALAWERFGRVADAAWRTRGFGDFWMHLLVAGGMAEAAFERDLKPWDIVALECIVTEAGGRLTDFEGGPALATGPGGAGGSTPPGRDVLTSNALVHAELQALLAG